MEDVSISFVDIRKETWSFWQWGRSVHALLDLSEFPTCSCRTAERDMSSRIQQTTRNDWIRIRRDQETGIESVHAHFRGHAYDPHDHDEVLVGITQQGVQQFRCHRSLHTSTPGRAILIEPGAVHDGHAPDGDGFTYAMLYLPQPWVADMMQRLGQWDISAIQPAFRSTLTGDAALTAAIQQAFIAVHHSEGRLARDQSLDRMMGLLSRHLSVEASRRQFGVIRRPKWSEPGIFFTTIWIVTLISMNLPVTPAWTDFALPGSSSEPSASHHMLTL